MSDELGTGQSDEPLLDQAFEAGGAEQKVLSVMSNLHKTLKLTE